MSLPLEIITDILLRLPAKTLLRLKIVCKLWYHLIKDSNFAKIHLERSLATKSNLHFVFKTPLLHLYGFHTFKTPVLHLADFDTFDNPIQLNYPYKNHGGVRIRGSCRGLLCLEASSFQDHLLIYNPTTQTYKRPPLWKISPPHRHSTSTFDYGFGYESVSDDYKVVKILVSGNGDMFPSFESESESEVMVYSLKDDIWRTATNTPNNTSYVHGNVYLNDTIHWVCYPDEDEELTLPIVTFDLRDESFSTLPLPNLVTTHLFCMVVGVLDGCLCLSVSYYDVIHLWAMKDYSMAGSWTLLYCLPKHNLLDVSRRPLCYSINFNKLFVNIPFREVASVNLETMVMTDVKVADFEKCTDAHLCVENLLMLEGRNNTCDKDEQRVKKKCRRQRKNKHHFISAAELLHGDAPV